MAVHGRRVNEIQTDLRRAFEDHGHDVADVSVNRDQVRVTVLDETPAAAELEAIAYEVVPESDVLGLNVTTEAIDGQDVIGTVIAFRYRG